MRLDLHKRGHIWYAHGPHKWRKSTGHTNERKARLVANRWEIEFANPSADRAHKATVSSAAERWMTEITAEMKPVTVGFYRTKIGHVKRLLGNMRLSKLTHTDVFAFTQTREREGASKHTVHRELTALRLTLRSAQRAEEFPRDVKTVLPRYKAAYKPLTDWVTAEEIWACIADLPPHRGAAVAFCIATACDFSSIALARRSDIKDDVVVVHGTKTASRFREVPRIKVMAPFLRHALAYAEPPGLVGDAPLFRPWVSMAADVRQSCRRRGVQQFTPRTLRRSAATWLVRAKVPYEIAAKFLGHGSTAMLQKVYGQLAPSDAGRMIDERLS